MSMISSTGKLGQASSDFFFVLFVIGRERDTNFANQSQIVVKQNQSKRAITLGTQLKTALNKLMQIDMFECFSRKFQLDKSFPKQNFIPNLLFRRYQLTFFPPFPFRKRKECCECHDSRPFLENCTVYHWFIDSYWSRLHKFSSSLLVCMRQSTSYHTLQLTLIASQTFTGDAINFIVIVV